MRLGDAGEEVRLQDDPPAGGRRLGHGDPRVVGDAVEDVAQQDAVALDDDLGTQDLRVGRERAEREGGGGEEGGDLGHGAQLRRSVPVSASA
jgi:hypothetical protein